MSNKETRMAKRQEKKDEKWERKYTKVAEGGRFTKWRHSRPFWGASVIVLASLLILYIPLQLYAIAFIPGRLVFIGFLFGGLLLIIGTLSYFYPQFSMVFGIMTIFLSVLSIMGALGGFVIGTILGIIGGSLLIAWEKQEINHAADKERKPELYQPAQQPEQNTVSTV